MGKTNNDRKYFTIIPNIIDDMDLSLSAFRLYVHIKRVAGIQEGPPGKCFQSIRTLAKECGLSTPTVTKAKNELLTKGLIGITPKDVGRRKPLHIITVVDIWNKNIRHYSEK